jgi:hypothetical protein
MGDPGSCARTHAKKRGNHRTELTEAAEENWGWRRANGDPLGSWLLTPELDSFPEPA